MKLIAIRDLANVKPLGLDAAVLKLAHENHIPKGTEFNIGRTEVFGDLTASEKVIVAQLNASKSAIVVNAANDALVKKIKDEVAAETKLKKAIEDKAAAKS